MGKFGEINSADTHAGKFPLVPMGAEQRVPRAQTREQGPPSALAEFVESSSLSNIHFSEKTFTSKLVCRTSPIHLASQIMSTSTYMGQISQEGNLLPQMSLNWYRKCHSCDHIFKPRIKLRGVFVPSCVVHDR